MKSKSITYSDIDYFIKVDPTQKLFLELSEFFESINTFIKLYSFMRLKSIFFTSLEAYTTCVLQL